MKYIRRYWYIFLLYALILLVGQRIIPPSSFVPESETYQLKIGVNSQDLFENVPTKAGQNYRATFALRLLPTDLASPNSFSSVKRTIVVNRSSAFAGEQKAADLELKPTTSWQYFEIQFSGSGAQEKIVLSKTETTERFSLATRALTISALAPSSSYKTTQFGDATITAIPSSLQNEPIEPIKLLGRSRTLIQVFPAEFEFLQGIQIPLMFQGYGGGRDYEFSIYEVNDTRLGARLASVSLNKGTAEEYRVTDDLYDLPLFAHLRPGNQYAFVVDGVLTQVSPFHYLSIPALPRSEQWQLFRTSSPADDLTNDLKLTLKFALLKAQPSLLDNQPMLSGQVVEDLGSSLQNTFSLFPEQSNGADVNEYSLTGNGRPAFSSKDQIMESLAEANSFYRYKIPLGGQLKQSEISFRSSDPASDAIQVSYSLDGSNWQRISADLWSRSGEIRKVVTGKTRTIWVEVAYRPVHDSQKVFGLKQLQVVSEVAK